MKIKYLKLVPFFGSVLLNIVCAMEATHEEPLKEDNLLISIRASYQQYNANPDPDLRSDILYNTNMFLITKKVSEENKDEILSIAENLNHESLKNRIEHHQEEYKFSPFEGFVIPFEIIEQIISSMDETDPKNLFNLYLVNHMMRQAVSSSPLDLYIMGIHNSDAFYQFTRLFPKTQSLEFSQFFQFTQEIIENLCAFEKLTVVNFKYNQRLEDKDFGFLSKLTTLTKLDLSGTGIKDDALMGLDKLINLKSLNLEYAKITKIGLEKLTPLIQLTYLNLERCNLHNQALQFISNLPHLKFLILRYAEIKWKDLECLGSLPALKYLDVSRLITINRSKIAKLKYLEKLKNLEILVLNDNYIEFEFLQYLSGMNKLETLSVHGTGYNYGIDKKRVQDFFASILPKLQVSSVFSEHYDFKLD